MRASRGAGLSSLRSASGEEIYATFYFIEEDFPAGTPLSTFQVDDELRFVVALRAFKNLALEGRIVFDEARRLSRTPPSLMAGRHPFMRLATIFTERAAGNRRLKVAAPVDADFSGLPTLPDRDNAFHLTRAAEQSGELGLIGEDWTRLSAHPAETRHTVDPDRDTNGAGLLYARQLRRRDQHRGTGGAERGRPRCAAAPPGLLRQRRAERSAAHHGGRVRPKRSERRRSPSAAAFAGMWTIS